MRQRRATLWKESIAPVVAVCLLIGTPGGELLLDYRLTGFDVQRPFLRLGKP